MSKIMLRIALLAMAAAILLASSAARAADGRVALIVGNGDYRHAPRLATPANDAQDIAAVLTGLGFDVILKQNGGIDDLRQAFHDFSDKSVKADIAIIYFAGYGVGASTEGYLIPIDAELSTAASFQDQAVPMQEALLDVGRAKLLGLVILDAMRGNPFTLRSAPQPAPAPQAPADSAEARATCWCSSQPNPAGPRWRVRGATPEISAGAGPRDQFPVPQRARRGTENDRAEADALHVWPALGREDLHQRRCRAETGLARGRAQQSHGRSPLRQARSLAGGHVEGPWPQRR
jgi:Caspase domain